MDNLCHTLAGLAIGETGLKQRTALAPATLMIGANLPDVDAFIYFADPGAALGFRRGWTHGILAMAVWPFVLAGIMLLVGRLAKRRPDPKGLLLLAAISVWSHPLLDLMNTYGVRLLMPFSGRWFYGDTLFIIDVWVLLALLAGIILSRRAQRNGSERPFRPGRIAVAFVLVYIAFMWTVGLIAKAGVRRELAAEGLTARRIMAGPIPLSPLHRDIVADLGANYETRSGTSRHAHPRPDSAALVRLLSATPDGRSFLRWTRFPTINHSCPRGYVCVADLRYFPQSWAEVAVPDNRGISSTP